MASSPFFSLFNSVSRPTVNSFSHSSHYHLPSLVRSLAARQATPPWRSEKVADSPSPSLSSSLSPAPPISCVCLFRTRDQLSVDYIKAVQHTTYYTFPPSSIRYFLCFTLSFFTMWQCALVECSHVPVYSPHYGISRGCSPSSSSGSCYSVTTSPPAHNVVNIDNKIEQAMVGDIAKLRAHLYLTAKWYGTSRVWYRISQLNVVEQ